tara:strand:- start:270 stop:1241 length:972 start_codon:yes stop_codon:yes gene_type:complete
MQMQDLYDDILYHVFFRLDIQTICRVNFLVCKQWKSVAESISYLWKVWGAPIINFPVSWQSSYSDVHILNIIWIFSSILAEEDHYVVYANKQFFNFMKSFKKLAFTNRLNSQSIVIPNCLHYWYIDTLRRSRFIHWLNKRRSSQDEKREFSRSTFFLRRIMKAISFSPTFGMMIESGIRDFDVHEEKRAITYEMFITVLHKEHLKTVLQKISTKMVLDREDVQTTGMSCFILSPMQSRFLIHDCCKYTIFNILEPLKDNDKSFEMFSYKSSQYDLYACIKEDGSCIIQINKRWYELGGKNSIIMVELNLTNASSLIYIRQSEI